MPRQRVPTWTDAELAILMPFKEEFRAGDKAQRKSLLETRVLHEFLKVHPNVEGAERDMLKRKVKEWFSNTGRKSSRPPTFALLPKASFAKVLLHEKREEIAAEARKMTDLPPSDPAYLGYLRRARTQVTRELGQEGREHIRKKQEEWEAKGWPQEKQKKEAVKKAHYYNRLMDDLRFKRMGMRSVTFAWFEDQDGQVGVEIYDNNSSIGSRPVRTFEDKFPREAKEMLETVWKYAAYIVEQEGGPILNPDVPIRAIGNGRRELPSMLRSGEGYPMLLEESPADKILQRKKDLLRGLLTSEYELATGRMNPAVPWGDIAISPGDWLEPRFWPADVQFKDPCKLKSHELDILLKFFRDRAAEDENEVFHWKQIATGRRGMLSYGPAIYPEDFRRTRMSLEVPLHPLRNTTDDGSPITEALVNSNIIQQTRISTKKKSVTFARSVDEPENTSEDDQPDPCDSEDILRPQENDFGSLHYISETSEFPRAGFIQHPSIPGAQIPIHGPESSISPYPPNEETTSELSLPPSLPPDVSEPPNARLASPLKQVHPDILAAAALLVQTLREGHTNSTNDSTIDPQLLTIPAPVHQRLLTPVQLPLQPLLPAADVNVPGTGGSLTYTSNIGDKRKRQDDSNDAHSQRRRKEPRPAEPSENIVSPETVPRPRRLIKPTKTPDGFEVGIAARRGRYVFPQEGQSTSGKPSSKGKRAGL